MKRVGAGYQTSDLRIVVVLWSEDCVFGPKVHCFVLVDARPVATIPSNNLGNVCAGRVVGVIIEGPYEISALKDKRSSGTPS